MRGSEALTKEIRDAAVTYERVVKNWPSEYLLSCGHYGKETERNPAYLGQVRYCQVCTDVKLRRTEFCENPPDCQCGNSHRGNIS